MGDAFGTGVIGRECRHVSSQLFRPRGSLGALCISSSVVDCWKSTHPALCVLLNGRGMGAFFRRGFRGSVSYYTCSFAPP
jgi:hypothetical protein